MKKLLVLAVAGGLFALGCGPTTPSKTTPPKGPPMSPSAPPKMGPPKGEGMAPREPELPKAPETPPKGPEAKPKGAESKPKGEK